MARWHVSVAVAGLALALGACGFRPLYGTPDYGPSVSAQLAAVDVEEQHTRIGQLVRNEIVAGISPAGGGSEGSYRLILHPVADDVVAIEGSDTDAVRRTFKLIVEFQLIDTGAGKQVYAGKTFSHVSYDRVVAPVANLQAEINAQERAAKEVGTDIRLRVAAFFSKH